ncbi:hypothetical protein BVRB_9g207610 [Beta vulgaris subsp. vulgaris]|nr:hypothetical protein BVRB_9g207610 [Beta vulgaris subsp. vulgaris]
MWWLGARQQGAAKRGWVRRWLGVSRGRSRAARREGRAGGWHLSWWLAAIQVIQLVVWVVSGGKRE